MRRHSPHFFVLHLYCLVSELAAGQRVPNRVPVWRIFREDVNVPPPHSSEHDVFFHSASWHERIPAKHLGHLMNGRSNLHLFEPSNPR